jgi:hypothetical protein
MTNADRIRALREQLRADREALLADIAERERELEDDPVKMHDVLMAESEPLVRSDTGPGDIIHKTRDNVSRPAADEAAHALPETFDDLDPALAGLADAVFEEIIGEKRARRYAVEKLRAELNTVAAKVDTLIAMLGGERAKSAEVVALPRPRDAS